MPTDLFDALDISLREDSYTRLIAAVLDRHRPVAAAVFEGLTGRTPAGGPEDVRFRLGIGPDRTANHPDLVVVAPTEDGVWWLVVESKLKSGEGQSQCDRYRAACEQARTNGECQGYQLIYLTLDGSPSRDPAWTPRKHRELALAVTGHDEGYRVEKDPVIGAAWRAYVARLDHYEHFPTPDPGEGMVEWLGAPPVYFVTTEERCRLLAKVLIPATWERSGGLYTARGRRQCLVLVWALPWARGYYREDGGEPLENCVSVHFELDIPYPFEGDRFTCHLHCETNPYMTERQVLALGPEAERFRQFTARFTDRLHQAIVGTQWRPSNRWLQKARLRCPLTRDTTIEECRDFVVPQLEEVRDAVSGAMLGAAADRELDWQ